MFKLYSSYDCLLKFNDKQEFLDNNTNLSFDNPCKISVYPVGKNDLYSFVLDLGNLKDDKFYKIQKYENNVYIFLVDNIISKTQNIYNFNIKKTLCQVFVSTTSIIFQTEKVRKKIYLPFTYKDYICQQQKNLITCQFNEGSNSLLTIFNPITNQTKSYYGHIENKSNSFILKNNIFDIEYIFTEDGLKINSFIENSELRHNSLALPYNFMVAILEKNFEYAYSLLDEKLQDKISKNQLKDFLPELKYFKFIEKNKCFAICEAQKIFVNFSVAENKILDITTN